jgi:uncharacterized protein with NRDE domain
MCLIAWNWAPASNTPLLLLANRDEFYARPAAPVHWWPGNVILAGKDLMAGGTWLGISRSGRLAALTNYRSPDPLRIDSPSRGELVADFLENGTKAGPFLHQLAGRAKDYNPFNLLVFDGTKLMGLQSRDGRVMEMKPGVGAVSNADFHTPWPKLARLRARLQMQLDQGVPNSEGLLALLHDRSTAQASELPHTGIPLDLERLLSATFIASPGYGTRACSIIRLHQTHAEFTEQSYDFRGLAGEQHKQFQF